MTVKIGLIGDYSPAVAAHVAIPRALELAARNNGCEARETWLATDEIEQNPERLSEFDALWCVPASPYKSMNGALDAIGFARTRDVPFLGTCGGFQHALIEYARNVLGFKEADHAESNAAATMPLIAPLACSLTGTSGTIFLEAGSRAREIYGVDETVEQYHCNFGFNPNYSDLFESGELQITGTDANGEARVVELTAHRFFVATLFQPERSAFSGAAHPLVCAYLAAAQSRLRAV